MRTALITVAIIGAAANAGLIFDTGVRPLPSNQGSYQPVHGTDFSTDSVVYQPFVVESGQTWTVGHIEVYTQSFADTDRTIRFSIAQRSAFLEPGSEIASTTTAVELSDPAAFGVWSPVDFSGTVLSAGAYILIAEYTQPNTAVWWHHGATGPVAVMGVDDQSRWFETDYSVALRIYGTTVPAPATGLLVALGLAGTRRRCAG